MTEEPESGRGARRVSEMAGSLIGSEILRIAADIRALKAAGTQVFNFTVGDFDPKQFPVPSLLARYVADAYEAGETNYPPSTGVAALREAVARLYEREFRLPVPESRVLVAAGSRPLIHSIYTTLLDPGDTVVYPVPSWNNNHYVHLSRCRGVVVECGAETGFLPTARQLEPHLAGARLLSVCSPLNPAGTCFTEEALAGICEAVVRENARRRGGRPLYLMFDMVYWMLTLGGARHHHPQALVPGIEDFLCIVDGASKNLCGTGLRVGWEILPKDLVEPFSSVLGHVGAWAPRPEQVATARFLDDPGAVRAFAAETRGRIEERLFPLHAGVERLRATGHAVEAVRPGGGIYLSLRLPPARGLSTDEEVREALLREAGIAVVPFRSFGFPGDRGWFRMSVGAVSVGEIHGALGRLEAFLSSRA